MKDRRRCRVPPLGKSTEGHRASIEVAVSIHERCEDSVAELPRQNSNSTAPRIPDISSTAPSAPTISKLAAYPRRCAAAHIATPIRRRVAASAIARNLVSPASGQVGSDHRSIHNERAVAASRGRSSSPSHPARTPSRKETGLEPHRATPFQIDPGRLGNGAQHRGPGSFRRRVAASQLRPDP